MQDRWVISEPRNHINTAFQFQLKEPVIISLFLCRCNHQHECSIVADSDNFGGDPCPGVPKYLEVYFGCFQGMLFYICFLFSSRLLFCFKDVIFEFVKDLSISPSFAVVLSF